MKMYPQYTDEQLVEELERECEFIQRINKTGKVSNGFYNNFSVYARQESLLNALRVRKEEELFDIKVTLESLREDQKRIPELETRQEELEKELKSIGRIKE